MAPSGQFPGGPRTNKGHLLPTLKLGHVHYENVSVVQRELLPPV
jgi:hypothetical protein